MGCRAALKRMFEKARMRLPYAGKIPWGHRRAPRRA
jgi:hypothetical protein